MNYEERVVGGWGGGGGGCKTVVGEGGGVAKQYGGQEKFYPYKKGHGGMLKSDTQSLGQF